MLINILVIVGFVIFFLVLSPCSPLSGRSCAWKPKPPSKNETDDPKHPET